MIKEGRAYKHKKSGNEILTQNFCTIRINQKKIGGIIYLDSELNSHVRTLVDFAEQCELIK